MGLVRRILLTVVLFVTSLPGFSAAVVAEDDCRIMLRRHIETGQHPLLRHPDFSRLREPLSRLYESVEHRPLWFSHEGPGAHAVVLASAMFRSDEKGLLPTDYDGDQWPERLLKTSDITAETPPCRAWSLDLALSVSAMRYVSDMRVGRVDPKSLAIDLDVTEKRVDLAEYLRGYLDAADPQSALDSVEPPFRGYRDLLNALPIYEKLAEDSTLDQRLEPTKKSLRPGEPYDQLPLLTYKLERLGDYRFDPADETPEGIYGGILVEGVKRFQGRHGLDQDGIIGRKTFAQLNKSMSERVRQIRLTLERWRWLPDDLGHRPVVINVPEYKLYAFESDGNSDYKLAMEMDVIVGRSYPKYQTPVFRSAMRYIVFSPYWNVPYTILKDELWEKIQEDPTYIDEHNYQVVPSYHPNAEPLVANEDNISRLITGELKLRQTPGPHNALGKAKFMFPNDHAVYLHGTPAQRLFYKDKRDFSHGCIRVADPPLLAEHVLHQEKGWDRERVDELVAGGERKQVNLRTPLEVFVLYDTAAVDEDGAVRFFEDIYGHDDRLAEALEDGTGPAIQDSFSSSLSRVRLGFTSF